MFWRPSLCSSNIPPAWQLGIPFKNESKNCYYAKESGA